MTNFLTSILGAFTNNNNTTKAKTTTDTSDQLTSKQLANYNTQAKDLVREYDTNRDGYLSAKEAKEMPLFEGQDLSSKMFDKLFTSLAQRGMSQVELSRTLQLMDADKDGKVTPQERAKFMNGLVAQIENGASPERIQAGINAKFLKNGGEVSDAKKTEWLEQFKEFDIPESAYTPKKATEDTDTTEEATGLGSIAEIVSPLIQSLMSKKEETSSTEKNANQASIDAQQQKQQLEQQLQLQQQLQTLNASSFNPSSLGAGAFPNALLTIPTLPTLSINDFNPLLAGGNNVPTAMPAQNTFAVAPLPIMNPQTQAPVAQAPPFTYIPPSDKWNVPFANAPTPVAQAQAPVAPTLVAQAPVNGGW